ncbi:MAG TPA: GAF domain-containing protein [Burkholderiales bacterium]|nr:GAF domain-containing protein [Burkholderiales bacterium]
MDRPGDAAAELAAVSEVLQLISGSPADVTGVLESIAAHAAKLCDASDAHVFVVDDDAIRHAAGSSIADSLKLGEIVPFSRQSVIARAIIDRVPVHVGDLDALSAREFGFTRQIRERSVRQWRTQLAVPLLRDGQARGALSLRRIEPVPFGEHDLELVQTLARQAVIALDRQRHLRETKELVGHQGAISEILRAISGSPTDVRPILYAVASSAMRATNGAWAAIVLAQGEHLELAALTHARGQEREAQLRALFPMPAERLHEVMETLRATAFPGFVEPSARLKEAFSAKYEAAAREGATAQELQALVDEYSMNNAALWSDMKPPAMRAMHRGGNPVGALMVFYDHPGEFSAKEKALLTTFAYQAEIAIENARLFHETQESLRNQTATADILRAIAASSSDVHPVFDAIAAKALRLADFQAVTVAIGLLRDGKIELASFASNWSRGVGSPWAKMYPLALDGGSVAARAILERGTQNITERDAGEAPEFGKRADGAPLARSVVAVPLMRQGQAIGVIVVFRQATAAAGKEKLAVLETFADQAVIAMDNVRLLGELQARNRDLRESLEHQTAMSDILKVVSATTSDADAVARAALDHACRLCEADGAKMFGPDEASLAQPSSTAPMPPGAAEAVRQAAREQRVVHLADIVRQPGAARLVDAESFRVLAVPLLRERTLIGVLALWRSGVERFGDAQVALLQSFADQVIIAAENARLYNEVQDKTRQLEAANQHKSDFLAHMSHELRTPLNAIIGFSEVLRERMFGELNERQDDYLKDIHESGKHLLALINDILDLSKIEAGRMELELSRFHLPSAISNALVLVRERALRHGVRLESEVDPRLAEFQADERKVKQVLLNLLSNAVKFTPDGGRVDVTARLDTDCVEIAVRDTGIGIAAEDQASLFEEFKQVGNSSRKAEGTGLGLALTKRFVELHGGRMRVESAPGKGSTFAFTLPMRA